MPYSSMLTGPLGLNTIPSARMDSVGTVKLGLSNLDPYVHGYLGIQLAAPLYVNIRQSSEMSSITDNPDRLYPGVDIKLRLLTESHYRPALVVGLQSAIGHKRMGGEYIALSKRYKDFDFTAGLGWGRYGTAAHFNNPFKGIAKHFGKARDLDGEISADPSDWFTGESIGIFGGVEYFTPVKGLSLKADYGADRYEAEQTAINFKTPAPWAVGANYQPVPWASLSLAAQGREKLMGRLTLKSNMKDWRAQHTQLKNIVPLRPFRTDLTVPEEMELSAQRENIMLQHTQHVDMHDVQTRLSLERYKSAPRQIGRAAVHIANHGGPMVERLNIIPSRLGLQGPAISLLRKDLEKAAHHQGSPEELWQSAAFDTRSKHPLRRIDRSRQQLFDLKTYDFTLENQISLAEEDSTGLYRSAFLFGKHATSFLGIVDIGATMRINLGNNLERLTQIRPRSARPVRSDVDLFAQRTIAIENAYAAFTHSLRPDLHLALIGGYLEEMYGGIGGEILYRPFGSRLAVGAELWQANKRSPFTNLNLGYFSNYVTTGHVSAWYDLPRHDLTLRAKAGRYLNEDIGLTLALEKDFKNGARLEGYVTISDQADFDLFGGTTHNDNGIRLSMPLGGYKHMPQNAKATLSAAPFGRDIGQSIRSPLPLYALTEPFSYDHIVRHWGEVLP